MSAHREAHLDLCASLAIGTIDDADRLELERHLAAGCPECERALVELSEGAVALAATATPVAPPAFTREAILERVRAEGTPSGARGAATATHAGSVVPVHPGAPRVWLTWGLAAAAALLAVTTVTTWRTASSLRGDLAAARDRVARVERDLAEERAWAVMLASPGTRSAELSPTPAGLNVPRVRATYDPASRRAVIAFEGLVTPAGSDYELWAILPDGPRSLGVVRGDASGRAVMRVLDAGDPSTLAAFAVSLEASGGSPDKRKPAGPVVLAAAIRG